MWSISTFCDPYSLPWFTEINVRFDLDFCVDRGELYYLEAIIKKEFVIRKDYNISQSVHTLHEVIDWEIMYN